MQKRELGKSGIKIAPLIFGGNVFGWTADEATSHAAARRFVDAGFMVDTADVYSVWVPGHRAASPRRSSGRGSKARRPRQNGDRDQGRHADGRRRARALGRDYIAKSVEIAQAAADRLHRPLPVAHRRRRTPYEETLGALRRTDRRRARCAPSARRILGRAPAEAMRAASEARAAALRNAAAALQSLRPRRIRAERPAVCEKENIGVIPYNALATAS